MLLLAALTPFNGVIALMTAGAVPAWWKEALLALTVLAAVLAPSARRGRTFTAPWWPAIALLAVLGSVSAVLLLGFRAWVPIKIAFAYLLIVFVLVRTPFSRRDRDSLVTIIMVVGVVNATYGIAQQMVGVQFLADLGYVYGDQLRTAGGMLRSFGTFSQPFAYALFLMLTLLVGLPVAFADPARMRNRLFLWLTPLLLAGMAVSVVRASYVGLLVGLVWIAALRYRKLFAGIAAAFLLAIPLIIAFVPQRALATFVSEDSFQARTAGWDAAWGLIVQHPLGQGFGTVGASAHKIEEGELRFPESLILQVRFDPELSMGQAYQPDNYYMKMLMELGPVGLWLLVLFLISAMVGCVSIARRAQFAVDSALALGVGALVAASAVASVVSTYFEIFPMDVYTWMLLGAVGCVPLRARAGVGTRQSPRPELTVGGP